MPIAGLTLTLNDDPLLAAGAIESLTAHPAITIGEITRRWVAAVMDAPDQRSGRDVHRWIESLDGIAFVDVVYVAFDEESAPAPAPLS